MSVGERNYAVGSAVYYVNIKSSENHSVVYNSQRLELRSYHMIQ